MKIDEDFTKPSLNLMRKALKGNGVRADNVSVKSFDGDILEFTAATHIKLNNKISEKTVPGRAAGETIFQNRQAALNEAESYAANIFKAPANIEQIKNLISQKPHKGFGLNNEIIKLSFLDREFTTHEPCNPCQGRGATQCAKCKGKGYQPCANCNAQGFEKCHECNGNRQTRGPQGQMQTCNLCQGLGKTSCSFCRENRQVQCSICKTKGEAQCKSCGGQGAQSNIVSTEMTAHCAYDFDAGTLPDKAVGVIKSLGGELAEQAQIKPINKETEDNEPGILRVFYDVRVPQGDVEFAIKDSVVKAYIFGTKSAIKDIPDFLDGIIASGAKKLAHAASGQGNISDNMRAAVKYKTVRQAVMLSARYNSKKALRALLHYTPLGLSNGLAQKLIGDANAALNNVTKQQRIIAIAAGIGTAIVLAAGYFFTPVRPAILTQITSTSLHLPINCAMIAACAALGYVVWQTISVNARKQALKSFMPSK